MAVTLSNLNRVSNSFTGRFSRKFAIKQLLFDTRNCRVQEMSETIWHERLKLSCKIQPFKTVVEKVLSGDVSII